MINSAHSCVHVHVFMLGTLQWLGLGTRKDDEISTPRTAGYMFMNRKTDKDVATQLSKQISDERLHIKKIILFILI